MRTIKGPAIFLAQFAGDKAPFDTLDNMAKWAASLGYKGVQIPTWASHFVDVEKAATSKTYADEVTRHRRAARHRHHRAFVPHHRPARRRASGLRHAVGRLCDPGRCTATPRPGRNGRSSTSRPAPQPARTSASTPTRPSRARWPGRSSIRSRSARPAWSKKPSTNWRAAGRRSSTSSTATASTSATKSTRREDLHDGVTYEMFLERVNNHPRANLLYDPSHFVLQQLDYLRLHRHLPRADQDVPRQGRGVQSDRPAGRLWRLPELGEPGRALPLARRRPGRFRLDLLQARRLRLRGLGRARMGMRHQASGRWRRARARPSSQSTSFASPSGPSTISRRRAPIKAANRKILGLS